MTRINVYRPTSKPDLCDMIPVSLIARRHDRAGRSACSRLAHGLGPLGEFTTHK